ncbi:Hypothetical protein AA314_00152 [Archangium gephyra]|uniref:Uncharacterized protein n=1 Tax=Archangium gephyra TaxID=48 RepID=A0AAC8Q0C6_9BACT|nr:Hypothetical protein AA314_00152 [Archangium gephyra]
MDGHDGATFAIRDDSDTHIDARNEPPVQAQRTPFGTHQDSRRNRQPIVLDVLNFHDDASGELNTRAADGPPARGGGSLPKEGEPRTGHQQEQGSKSDSRSAHSHDVLVPFASTHAHSAMGSLSGSLPGTL